MALYAFPIDKTQLFIKQWQEKTPLSSSPAELGAAGRLYGGCIQLGKHLASAAQKQSMFSSRERIRLRRYIERLCLWGNDHGASGGELDAILQCSRRLRQTVLEYLIAIGEILSQRLSTRAVSIAEAQTLCTKTDILKLIEESRYAVADDDDDDGPTSTFSDGGSDTDFDSTRLDVKDILEDLDTYTQCLVDLSPSLACPAMDCTDTQDASVNMIFHSRDAHQYYADLIRERFPEAATDIVDQLGRTNWERYKRVSAERTAFADGVPVAGKAMSEATASQFQDSGLGSSLPTATHYAPSVTSYFSSLADGDRPHIPSLPEEAKRGTPFECDACGKIVRVTNKRDWKKHVYRDLQPYVCFYPHCAYNATPFRDREVWTDHLLLEHGLASAEAAFVCLLCQRVCATGRGAIVTHLARHMEEISLAALPRGTDSEVDSESGSLESQGDLAASDSSNPSNPAGYDYRRANDDLLQSAQDLGPDHNLGSSPHLPHTTITTAAPDEAPESASSARPRPIRPRVVVTHSRASAPSEPESETSTSDEDADIRFRDAGREELRRRNRRSAQAAEKAAADAEARRATAEAEERAKRDAEDAQREKDRLTAREKLRKEDEWTRRETARFEDRERQRDEERRKREKQEQRRRDSEAAARLKRDKEAKEAAARAEIEAEAQRRLDEYEDLLRRMEREREEAARWAAEEEVEAAQQPRVRFESPPGKREQQRDLDTAAHLRREKLAADIRRTEADVAYWTARARAPVPEPVSPTSPLRERRGGGGMSLFLHSSVEEPVLGESLLERRERVIAREKVRMGTRSGKPYLEDGLRERERTYSQ